MGDSYVTERLNDFNVTRHWVAAFVDDFNVIQIP
jgi:hypothetical protein